MNKKNGRHNNIDKIKTNKMSSSGRQTHTSTTTTTTTTTKPLSPKQVGVG